MTAILRLIPLWLGTSILGCSREPAEASAPAAPPSATGAAAVASANASGSPPPRSSLSAAPSSQPVPAAPTRGPTHADAGASDRPSVREGHRATRVLHFGDSMVPLVGNYLRPVYEAHGARYVMLSTHSSSTRSWASDARLLAALQEHDPDLVLISLGTNELFDQDLAGIARALDQLTALMAPRACLWIAPPAWAKDAGFAQTLREHRGSCEVFDSTRLRFTRQSDGRHPDWSSSYRWAAEVWSTLGGTSRLPTGSKPKP